MKFSDLLPYIVAIITPIITGLLSLSQANKKAKQEVNKLREEHKTNLEELKAKFEFEMQAKQKEQNMKIELMEKEIELKAKDRKDKIGETALDNTLSSFMPQLMQEVLSSKEGKDYIQQSIIDSINKNKK